MSNLETDTTTVARVFKALSNPHRLAIFLKLAGCLGVEKSIDVSDAGISQCQLEQAKAMGLAPSTVSHHYKELRNAGLIRMERQGKNVRCWIDAKTIRLAKGMLELTPVCPAAPDDKE